jgi:hypothetical protein
MALQHFLLRFNLRTQTLEQLTEFGRNAEEAMQAYSELEEAYRDRADQDDFEIVLIGADSIDTIRVTHSRYFDGGVSLPRTVGSAT